MKTVIIGAGNKTRMVLDYLLYEGRISEIHGIVDRNTELHGRMIGGIAVLGSLDQLLAHSGDLDLGFCICLGEDYFSDRAKLTAEVIERGCQLKSIVSARAHISPSASVAPGVILYPGVTVGTSARVGTCVTAMTEVLIEHDCVVDDNVEIAPRAVLAGGAQVRSCAFIGIHSTVFPRITVGTNATVGGSAVVTRHVASNTVVVGNPARALRVKDA